MSEIDVFLTQLNGSYDNAYHNGILIDKVKESAIKLENDCQGQLIMNSISNCES